MKLTLFFSFFLASFSINSQHLISKEAALNKAKKQNIGIKIAKQEVEEAQGGYQQSNALFLPTISASHTGIATTNPLMAFGSKLNQEILSAADFNPSLLNNPSQIQNYATKVEFLQPLVNIDGIYQRKASKATLEAMQFKAKHRAGYLKVEVTKSYMQLQLAYKTVLVLEKALYTAKETQKIMQLRSKEGLVQYADVLAVTLRVTDLTNQLQVAQSNITNASDYLSLLMNDTSATIYMPSEELQAIDFSSAKTQTLSTTRADIKAIQLASVANKAINTSNKLAFLPRLNIFGTYELHANSPFKGTANGYLFGAQLHWNILEGGSRLGAIKKSTAAAKKADLSYKQYVLKSTAELNQASRNLHAAKRQLTLTKDAVALANEALRIRTNRFKEGLEKTIDVLYAETQYAQTELQYYQTIFTYNYAIVYYQFLTTK